MHNKNVCGIVFKGKDGKNAISQIFKAKPVNNKYTKTVKIRSENFVKNFKSVPAFEK